MPTLLELAQQRIIGSLIGSRRDMVEVLELAKQACIRPWIETFALDQANEVHDKLRANELRFRGVLLPN